ncbi:Early nodulin-12A [Frankliniella fusca]|uniref:Early nodulin-12A n=1 Tax=Frankliniella fusca TaxID=407009 RepID=A0AAE1H1U2_9NEOP|nr:Early nodulin-12A [Frankliniella fusca]
MGNKENIRKSKDHSSNKSKTLALLHWVDEDKVSIEPLAKITNEEERYVGAPTTIRVGSKNHKARVIMISGEIHMLEDKEREMCEEIEKRKQARLNETLDRKGRSSRSRYHTVTGSASSNQLASAFGEKIPAPTHIHKELASFKRMDKQSVRAAENASVTVDKVLLNNATRKIFPGHDEVDSDSGSEEENPFGNPHSTEKEAEEADDYDDEISNAGSDTKAQETAKVTCDGCRPLVQSVIKSVPEFLIQLEKFIATSSASSGERFLEILPIPEGVPRVEVSKGSKVYMSVHDKNDIKSDSQGNPVKMVRECMIRLFGRANIESVNITAKGSRIGTMGVRPEVREAIRKFANRNKAPQYKALDPKNVTRAINRKKNQVRRTNKSKSPRTPQKGLSSTRQKSKVNGGRKETPTKETPRKETPRKLTPRKETPRKETPRKETPRKETPRKETPRKETPRKQTPRKSDTLPMSWEVAAANSAAGTSGANQQYGQQHYYGYYGEPYPSYGQHHYSHHQSYGHNDPAGNS